MEAQYCQQNWCGLAWSKWIDLISRSREREIISNEQGVYRVRVKENQGLVYIGQTNNLKRRTGSLARHTNKREMPWNDPHTAAPNLWAWKQEKGWNYEVSIATTNLTKQNRMALECFLLWQYRLEKGESTLCNHGKFHPDYTKPSNKKANRIGRKLEENEARNPSWSPSYPPLIPWNNYYSMNWMKLPWNKFQLFSKQDVFPIRQGIYRMIDQKTQDLLYIGESNNLNNRLSNHKRKFHNALFSYVILTQEINKIQRLEIENDLIGHYYILKEKSPQYQFNNG
ncbi:MAG: GIY-YIG nuclease family protein [Promethearchaeota archaeon]